MATRDRALLEQFCSEAKEAEDEGDFTAAIQTYTEGTRFAALLILNKCLCRTFASCFSGIC
jgi:hypothetical protein